MPVSPEELFAFLDMLGIEHQTVEHEPVYTVNDGAEWRDKVAGLHCKNLFLKDKKGGLWLVVMPADKRADLGKISQRAGAPRMSFGSPELMQEVLGLTPGSVTPFALMNDTERLVTVILDRDMMASELVNYHPLHNAASTTLRSDGLLKFLNALGYEPVTMDCGSGADALSNTGS